MENTLFQTILDRRSIRAYKDEKVTEEQKQQLLAAALASPTAANRQGWHFTFCEDQALLDRINAATCATAMKNAKTEEEKKRWENSFHVFFHAPLVVFISAPKKGEEMPWFSEIDVGIATENINLAAEAIGLGGCILGFPRQAFLGDEKEELEKALKFPEGYEFKIAISLGQKATTKGPHPVGENKYDFV